MTQFTSQFIFLIVVVAISYAADLNDVVTGQLSQAINCAWSSIFFYLGWKLLPSVPTRHELAEGERLLTQGFKQVYRTAVRINKEQKRGLRWYFLALTFSESTVSAFSTVAVVYLDEQLGLSAQAIGLFFLTVVIASLPGSLMATKITNRMDPRRSWQYSMITLLIWSIGGILVVDRSPVGVSYVWGVGIGVLLGWYYPTSNLFFSMCLPKGQEAVSAAGGFSKCCNIFLTSRLSSRNYRGFMCTVHRLSHGCHLSFLLLSLKPT